MLVLRRSGARVYTEGGQGATGDEQAGQGLGPHGWTLTQQEEALVVVQRCVPEQVPLVRPQLLPVLQGEVHAYALEGHNS